MSATDELRRLLDERGVAWEDVSPIPSMSPWKTSFMSFTGEEISIAHYDESKWLMGAMVFHTPGQVVAATLGPDTAALRGLAEGLYSMASEMHAILRNSDQSLLAGYYGACLKSARDKMRELGIGEVDG